VIPSIYMLLAKDHTHENLTNPGESTDPS
jgi:hypothetical protein